MSNRPKPKKLLHRSDPPPPPPAPPPPKNKLVPEKPSPVNDEEDDDDDDDDEEDDEEIPINGPSLPSLPSPPTTPPTRSPPPTTVRPPVIDPQNPNVLRGLSPLSSGHRSDPGQLSPPNPSPSPNITPLSPKEKPGEKLDEKHPSECKCEGPCPCAERAIREYVEEELIVEGRRFCFCCRKRTIRQQLRLLGKEEIFQAIAIQFVWIVTICYIGIKALPSGFVADAPIVCRTPTATHSVFFLIYALMTIISFFLGPFLIYTAKNGLTKRILCHVILCPLVLLLQLSLFLIAFLCYTDFLYLFQFLFFGLHYIYSTWLACSLKLKLAKGFDWDEIPETKKKPAALLSHRLRGKSMQDAMMIQPDGKKPQDTNGRKGQTNPKSTPIPPPRPGVYPMKNRSAFAKEEDKK